MPSSPTSRLGYIDWMRGLACVLMFQTHCYDAWLNPEARKSTFFMWSQLGGTLPAPLFLFLAGVSVALVVDKQLTKQQPIRQIALATIRRGAEILALGLLFRLQEFVIAWGWAPGSDLLRVDILNTIGVSMMLLGLTCWIAGSFFNERPQRAMATSAVIVGLAISLLTPLLWTVWAPNWLPWPIESYINGVHNLGTPQAWLFPIFPWSAFAFAGLATGFILQSSWARSRGALPFLLAGVVGVCIAFIARWLDRRPEQLYPVYDFWHTSPNFFLIRVGLLLVILALVYAWCRWGAGQWGFSPLIQLGQTSLLVYWVHIEFVYGRFSIMAKKSQTIASASLGLLAIFISMLVLSILRTSWKRRRAGTLAWQPRAIGSKSS
ncbi:MAG TPA: heparan-alpha-glucosaminide N-acetyltransferase domain-containing protein [Terriglobales bacterium]